MAESIEVESIRRLVVQPGETLVVTLPFTTTAEEAHRIGEQFRQRVPDGVRVMLTTSGVELTVLTTDPQHVVP